MVQWKKRRSSNHCSEGKPRPGRNERIWCFGMAEIVKKKIVCDRRRKERKNEQKILDSCFTKKGEVGVSAELKRGVK